MRPTGEGFADAIGQHSPRPHFNEDAGSSLIERLDLGQELYRAHKVFH
jgi:hypothetical protein